MSSGFVFLLMRNGIAGTPAPPFEYRMPRKSLQSAARRVIVSLVLLRKYQGAAQNGRRLATPPGRG